MAPRAAITLHCYLEISCRQLPLFVHDSPQLFNKLLLPALEGALQPHHCPDSAAISAVLITGIPQEGSAPCVPRERQLKGRKEPGSFVVLI